MSEYSTQLLHIALADDATSCLIGEDFDHCLNKLTRCIFFIPVVLAGLPRQAHHFVVLSSSALFGVGNRHSKRHCTGDFSNPFKMSVLPRVLVFHILKYHASITFIAARAIKLL
ncbi:MAG: hypothetical protein IJ634_08590 [Bacteroidales bacterium]|nr:hypothetical protein [Bacteroidales bacterium]